MLMRERKITRHVMKNIYTCQQKMAARLNASATCGINLLVTKFFLQVAGIDLFL